MGTIFSGRLGLKTGSNRLRGMRSSLLIAWAMSALPIGVGAAPVVSGPLEFVVAPNTVTHSLFDFPVPGNCPDCNEPLAMVAKFAVSEVDGVLEFNLISSRTQGGFSPVEFSTASGNSSVTETASGLQAAMVRARFASDPAAAGYRILVLSVRFDTAYHGYQNGERWTVQAKSNASADRYFGYRVDGVLAVAGDLSHAEALVTKSKTSITPTDIDFGEIDSRCDLGRAPVRSIILANQGTSPLNYSVAMDPAPGNSFSILSSINSYPVLPMERKEFRIQFHPPEIGAFTGMLKVGSEGGGREIALKGRGTCGQNSCDAANTCFDGKCCNRRKGEVCNPCGGRVQCDGQCLPALRKDYGNGCGACGGTIACQGCSNTTPLCPPGFAHKDGVCRGNPAIEIYRHDFSFGGVREWDQCEVCGGPLNSFLDRHMGCGDGRVRSSLSAARDPGSKKPGFCEAGWLSDDPSDCGVRVKFRTDWMDNFICNVRIKAVYQRPICGR